MNERPANWRDLVVAEALSWTGTRYHHLAGKKHVGVDCAQFLVRVFVDSGIVEPFETGKYDAQWYLHKSEERYLGWVAKYAHRIEASEVKPADIMMFRFGRCAAHGAIVLDEQRMIHSYQPAGCVEITERWTALRGQFDSFWSLA
jgi:NlpC/P60 family putative phage cell wall peptidase